MPGARTASSERRPGWSPRTSGDGVWACPKPGWAGRRLRFKCEPYKTFSFKPCEHEPVDPVGRPIGRGDGRRLVRLRHHIRPVRRIRGTGLDPPLEEPLLLRVEHMVRLRRRHDRIGVSVVNPRHEFAIARLARHDRRGPAVGFAHRGGRAFRDRRNVGRSRSTVSLGVSWPWLHALREHALAVDSFNCVAPCSAKCTGFRCVDAQDDIRTTSVGIQALTGAVSGLHPSAAALFDLRSAAGHH